MGNVVQCCHVLSNYIRHKDVPARGDAERSPLLSREGSECDSFTPLDNLDEEEEDDDDDDSDLSTVPAMAANPTLEQGRFLFPDIILSSSLGGEVSVVEPVVCLLVSEEEEEGLGEKGPESGDRGRKRLYTEFGTQTGAWLQTQTQPCHAEVQTQTETQTQTEMPTHSSRVADTQKCTEANTQTKAEMIKETITERFAGCELQTQADVLSELQPRADKETPVLSTEIGPLAETMALSGKQPACIQSLVQVSAKVCGQRERCTLISGEVVKDVQVEQRETGIQDRLTDIKYDKDTFLKEHSHDPVEEVITNTKQIVHEITTTMDLNTASEGEQLDWEEHSTFQTQMHVRGLVLNSGSPQQGALMPTEHNADDMEQIPDLLQKDTNRSQQNVDLPEHSTGNVQITECVDYAAPCVNQTQQETFQVAEKVEETVGQRAVWIPEKVPGEEDYVVSAKLEPIELLTAECTDQKNPNAGESVDQAHQNSIQKVQSTVNQHDVNQTHQNAVQTIHSTGELNDTADHESDLNIVQTVQDIVQAEHSADQADGNIVPSEKNVDEMNKITVETERENPEPDQSTAEPKTVDNLDETAMHDAVELEGSGSQVKEEQPDETKQVTLFLVDRLFLATPHVKVPPLENVKTSVDATSKEFDEDKGEGLSIQEVVSLQEAVLTIRIQSPGTETFEIQISGQMLVAELNQVLMDHEQTCHRTCFSLHLGGAVLDSLVELHSVPGIQDEALIKVVEETYTVRDARLHLGHVRDLLRSLDPTDAHNGVNGSSLSYLSIYTEGETEKESGGKRRASEKETVDCSPPEYILPGCKECPLTPLQPVRHSWKPLQCLRVLTMSSWNPPPGNRKMHGDLMYINVVTMEDRDLNITSSTRGFYLNQSTAFTFNPKPALPKILCHSLVELLSQVSPAFRKSYSALQKKRVQRHPYERIVTPFQVYTWTAPHGDHALDWVRAEETHTIRMGQDEHNAGQSRDWNEELQCCRELPRNTVQERLQRERNIFKTNSDFVGAATRGAMAVVDGNVMAINPGEAPHMQMFIWNSMFFSLGFDISDHYRPLGGNAAAHTAANCDQRGVQAYAAVDTEGLHTLGTAVVDYRGYRVIAQTIVAGILEKSQDESVVYGSNDHGKTVLSHPRFMELLEKTSGPLRLTRHSVIDHSDSPVELYSSIDTKGILGNDGRHYILDLLRTFPRDLNFLLSEEEKGEVPTECRSFGYPRQHRHSLAGLRPELIDAFVQHRYELFLKMVSQGLRQLAAGPESQDGVGQSEDMARREDMEAEDIVKILGETGDTAPATAGLDVQRREMIMEACKATGSVSDSHFDIRFNPDVCCAGVRFPSECAEELLRQKQLLWDAAAFLLSNQIPAVLRDCLDQTAVPMDGATLTVALHQRGVSVRYLGTLLELLERSEERERLSHIERIAISELVIRSAKHIFKIYLQDVEPASFSAAVSHFLNCLLGSSSSFPDSGSDELLSRRRGRRRRTGSHGSRAAMLADSVWARLTPGDLWVRLRKEAEDYYHYTLCSDSIDDLIEKYSLQKISLLREMTMKTGIQVQLREYAFDSRHRPVFGEEDVVNMFPVVKHLRPTSSDATRLIQHAQVAVQQGLLKDGYEILSQALTLFSTVCGVLHEDMCMCLRLLGRISYILGEYQDALSHQEKVAMVSERVQGIDHPQTTQDYTYLALYCFAGRQHSTSLHLLYRARYLTLLVSGEDHPQLALLDSMLGLVLHGLMEYDLSLKFLQNALTLTSKFHGAKSVKHAHSHHLLATVFESKGEFRSALHHEKEAYSIYKDQVGESHESTKESSEYLKRLTQQAVILQKALNHIYSNTSSACIPPPKFSTPSLPMILQQLNLTCGIIFIPLRAKDLGDLTSELKGRGTAQALDHVENQQTLKDSRSADG